MPAINDGPRSPLFTPLPLRGNASFSALSKYGASETMEAHHHHAPTGACTCWGIPFEIKRPIVAIDAPITIPIQETKSKWLVFLHTTDAVPLEWNDHGFISPTRGAGRLGERVADYVLLYADGFETSHSIRRRFQIGMFQRGWGENCFEAVSHHKPFSIPPVHQQVVPNAHDNPLGYYGMSETRVREPDILPWVNWLWAWENPSPGKVVVGIRIEPKGWPVILSGLAAGNVASQPLRWEPRRKAILVLPKNQTFDPKIDAHGCLAQIQLDLGQVISARPRSIYPNDSWTRTHNNQAPEVATNEILVEYTAHPDARFRVLGKGVPVSRVENQQAGDRLIPVAPATQRVHIRVIEKSSKQPVAVKLHIHGNAGEYLAPLDRHRIPNPGWIEDYAPEFVNQLNHTCTYISGETVVDLPLGKVYIEISKGFEIRPIRRIVSVTQKTKRMTLTIERILPWRERGWVTADTHVHFLSPATAMLEGAAEGVNVVNLLASQWGELMTNVGDFDGKTTFGSEEAGGSGEWLVRVGTENRQHVLGHISLLGYSGLPILPLCVGGPDESALGDTVGVLMSEWAQRCRKQGGLVVMPHFPNPRCENAANLISGDVDAIEWCSWNDLYSGIDPYSLSDWYRYLNCGYFYPAVGGTDKMTTQTAVGAIRTYARIQENRGFTYQSWMDAVRSGNTFVTYGPLLEFTVEGKPAGARIQMTRNGGSVSVDWEVASVTIPITRVDLVVNGEIRESTRIDSRGAYGLWSLPIKRSSWIAILIRGLYPRKKEMIVAHSSPVVVDVESSSFFAERDAVTILEQIEGAIAYIDTIGTRADARAYKRMRLTLTSAHRRLHNQLHRLGHDHHHEQPHDHPEHKKHRSR